MALQITSKHHEISLYEISKVMIVSDCFSSKVAQFYIIINGGLSLILNSHSEYEGTP